MPSKDCYQVKVHATMTNELKCLYEKLGVTMFTVEVVTEFSDVLFLESTEPDAPVAPVPELSPEILEVEFDKCDPCKVTFTVYVELPRGVLNDPSVDIDPEDDVPDERTMPVEHKIRTGGHLNPLEMSLFTVYPLRGPDPETGLNSVTSVGYETDCYSYEQARVPCKATLSQEVYEQLPLADSFRVTFPLSREVACLIPELGLSGFYLKNLISTSVKSKVRLVPINTVPAKGTGQIPAGLLSYDPERCEACVEVCTDQASFDVITEGYEHLFNFEAGDAIAPPDLNQMAMTRRYEVRGVSKCTEKSLFTFEICYKPPLIPLVAPNTNYMNYSIVAADSDTWCYEFSDKTEDLQVA